MEKYRNKTDPLPRLLLAGSLLAATACINFVNVQINAVMPDLASKTRVTRTATSSAVKEIMFEFDDEAMKLFEDQPKYVSEDESEGSGSSLRALK